MYFGQALESCCMHEIEIPCKLNVLIPSDRLELTILILPKS